MFMSLCYKNFSLNIINLYSFIKECYMSCYIVCHKKRNNPRMDVRICMKKCSLKDDCEEYNSNHKILCEEKNVSSSTTSYPLEVEVT